MDREKRGPKGRGSHISPVNRFEAVHVANDWEHFEGDADFLAEADRSNTEYLPDDSQTIVSRTTAPTFRFATASIPIAAVRMAAAIATPGRATNILG